MFGKILDAMFDDNRLELPRNPIEDSRPIGLSQLQQTEDDTLLNELFTESPLQQNQIQFLSTTTLQTKFEPIPVFRPVMPLSYKQRQKIAQRHSSRSFQHYKAKHAH